MAVGITAAGHEASAQCVGTRDTGFQRGARGRESLKALEFFDNAKAARGSQFAGNRVTSSLVMRGRTEPARRRAFAFQAIQVRVKGKVEIEARLFAVGDDVEAGAYLIVECGNDGVLLQLSAVVGAEFIKIGAGEFQPAGQGITADNR